MNVTEAITPWDGDLVARRLVVNRRRQVAPAVLLTACAVAVLFQMARSPLALQVIVVVVVLALLILGVLAVVRPPSLHLDQQGLTVRRVFGTGFEPWTTCGAFTLTRVGGREVISFAPWTMLRAKRRLTGFHRPIAGGSMTLPADLDRLPGSEVVALLNLYRDAGRVQGGPGIGQKKG